MARSIFAAFLSVFGIGGSAATASAAPKPAISDQKPAADQSVDYMAEIARVILDHEKIESDWDEFSLVMGFDEDGSLNQTYGYAYDASGKSTPFSIRPRFLSEPAEAYREWLRTLRDGKAVAPTPVNDGVMKILFQFNRRSGKVNADFEYDDPARWKVGPDTLDAMVKELRPNL